MRQAWWLGPVLAISLGASARTPPQPPMAEVIGGFSSDVTLFKASAVAGLARQAGGAKLTVFVPTDRACRALGVQRMDAADAARLLRSHAFKGTLFGADTLAYLQPGQARGFAVGWRSPESEEIRRIGNGDGALLSNLDGSRLRLSVAGTAVRFSGYGEVLPDTAFDARDGVLVAVDDCRIWSVRNR